MVAADGMEKRSLKTRRLVLAPLRASYARALHALIDDWEVVKWLSEVPWPVTPESVQDFAERQERAGSGNDAFAILLAGAPIGVCSVKHPGTGDPPRKMPRLAYWIGRPYWRKGFGTEAIGALTAHAFAAFPDTDVVGAGVFLDNPASRRVLEKLGFRQTGRKEVLSRSRGGQVPTVDMQLTRGEWMRSARS
ncbi:MAG: GNAT family N-acetyltransferase [Propylenella sp.]